MPEVTILLPVHDGLPHLGTALSSLRRQSLQDWRCLVWNDASRDGSGALLEAVAARDPRFRILGDGHRHGVAGALQHLLAEVRTPWLARMDADDRSHPQRLAVQLQAAREHPEIALWASRVESLGSATPGWLHYLDWVNGVCEPTEIRRQAFTECPLPHPTWFARTAALRDCGGYRQGPFPEDYDLFLRLLRAGEELAKVPQVLLAWRDHPTRETRTSPRTRRDAFLRLKARHFARGHAEGSLPFPQARPLAVWGTGKTGRILARELTRHGAPPVAFVDPVGPARLLAGVPVLPPDRSPPGRHLLLVAVGPRPLREQLRARFLAEGRRFAIDYLWLF